MRGTNSARSAASRPRPRRREREQHHQRDRRRDPGDDQRRARSALRGEPDLVAEPGAERHDDVAGVTRFSVAGSTTMPVKIGTNSHTRLTKKPTRQPGRRREHERDDVEPRPAPASCARATPRQEQPSSVRQLDPRVEPLQQPGRAAMSSANMAWRMTSTRRRIVFSTKLPLRRRPMQPHGHSPTSRLEQPVGVVDSGRRLMRAPRLDSASPADGAASTP